MLSSAQSLSAEKHFHSVRVGQSYLGSQVRLLPIARRRQCFIFSQCRDSEGCRATTDAGSVTQGHGVPGCGGAAITAE